MFNLKDATKSETNDNEYISTKCHLQNEGIRQRNRDLNCIHQHN